METMGTEMKRVWDDRNPQMPGVEQSPRSPSIAGQLQVGVAWIASCIDRAGAEPAEIGCISVAQHETVVKHAARVRHDIADLQQA